MKTIIILQVVIIPASRICLVVWAAANMTAEKRSDSIYSGEHCPIGAAHGWVGLGRIVYASSSEQLVQWLEELGVEPTRVRNLPIQDVIRDTIVEGPVPELAEQVRQLHYQYYAKK